MAFGKRLAKPVEVTVKSYGEDITLRLRPLSALEVDQIRSAYPPPIAPRKENSDGATVIDDKDAEYQRALGVWLDQFFALKICRMIGAAEFGTDDLMQQIALLKADFTETEYLALIGTANKVGAGEITQAHMEAAKEQLVPFASAPQEASAT